MDVQEFRARLLRELNAIDSKYAGLIKNESNLLMCAVELDNIINKIWAHKFLFPGKKEDILQISIENKSIYGMNNIDCKLEALKMSFSAIFNIVDKLEE